MKNRDTRRTILAATGMAGFLTAVPVNSQSGGGLELIRTTLDAGGGRSTGATLVLTGTIGQFDASPQPSSGGTISLAGGLWSSSDDVQLPDDFFKSGFE